MEKHTPTIVETMAKPILGLDDMIRVLDLPESTLEEILAEHPPAMFTLGRRRYVKTKDLMPWIDSLAARNPWWVFRATVTGHSGGS